LVGFWEAFGYLAFGISLSSYALVSLFLLFRLTKCKEDFQVDGFFVCTGFLWESINGDK
jgi:hypothetical protein